MTDNGLLGLIGLAQKAGKAEAGDDGVTAAALGHKARVILVAADAAENTRDKALTLGQAGNAPTLITDFTKAELGGALGRSSCALLALTDTGFAASAVKKLAQADPQRYDEAAQALGRKAEKADRRRKEQRAKEKARLAAGRKPWAAPPKHEGKKP